MARQVTEENARDWWWETRLPETWWKSRENSVEHVEIIDGKEQQLIQKSYIVRSVFGPLWRPGELRARPPFAG